jgi:hypothetical protein
VAVLDNLVRHMKQLFAGVAFGAAVYLLLDTLHMVNRPVAIAIFAGAMWAWSGMKEKES